MLGGAFCAALARRSSSAPAPRSSMVKLWAILRAAQVGADGGQRRRGFFREPDVGGAAADRLDADRAGAGVEVDEAGPGDARREDVEEGLAQAVAGGARAAAARGDERARAIGAGDDAHPTIMTRDKTDLRINADERGSNTKK